MWRSRSFSALRIVHTLDPATVLANQNDSDRLIFYHLLNKYRQKERKKKEIDREKSILSGLELEEKMIAKKDGLSGNRTPDLSQLHRNAKRAHYPCANSPVVMNQPPI